MREDLPEHFIVAPEGVEEVRRILLSSHAHYDHAAGAAEVFQETHAQYMVMDGDVDVIKTGGATDFDPTLAHFPPTRVDRTLHDNDTVTLGGSTITAHKTAGHTRGHPRR